MFSGLGRAVVISKINPEARIHGDDVSRALHIALPKLAVAFKALPAAMGPMGIAALALSLAAYKAVTFATRQECLAKS